ncbi:hypothetical protein CPB84DRAFT_1778371 [Gymnopilus junonius]|uniref:Uncharacterized protein n=1 Tax=Gymnopilus junonius TaxID=109634 RepID=A0A9P5NL56_GYMJU|nr:hypothetical protein CPB84DRAFT_1778371 [Gymnopilus junonius]
MAPFVLFAFRPSHFFIFLYSLYFLDAFTCLSYCEFLLTYCSAEQSLRGPLVFFIAMRHCALLHLGILCSRHSLECAVSFLV